jgi:hypothetical protein
MLGILGGGFGLYGYLPAAVKLLQEPVLLLNKYKPIIDSRQELLSFKEQIIWLESEEELIQSADSLVISRRPIDQERLISECLLQTNLKRIMFEKPLASSPQKAQNILDQVASSDKYCSVGFTFRFTNWAMQLKEKLLNGEFSEHESISLSWHFMADHFSRKINNWKMDHTQGGGAIRFYGIHVIALLAEWGYSHVGSSSVTSPNIKHNFYCWRACFEGPGLPKFFINLDSKSNSCYFKVDLGNDDQVLFEGLGPFNPDLNNLTLIELDTRYIYLMDALQELFELSKPYPIRIEDCTKLWQSAENKTVSFSNK